MRLEADAVRLRYGARTILDRVSFRLEPGELAGLVGPNGAGKTSLLRLLAGLVAPDAGEVRLDGRPFASVSRTARADNASARAFSTCA